MKFFSYPLQRLPNILCFQNHEHTKNNFRKIISKSKEGYIKKSLMLLTANKKNFKTRLDRETSRGKLK